MQRKSTSGRPLGTDGSDFSYRMVVDSRYQRVAQGKSRLHALILSLGSSFINWAIIQIIGVLYTFLWTSGKEGPDRISISAGAVGLIYLIIGKLGLRRTRASLLKFCMVGSSVATFLSIASVAKENLILEVVQNPSNWEAKKVELLETTSILLDEVEDVSYLAIVLYWSLSRAKMY